MKGLLALALAPGALAHLALYHPAMYGFKPDVPWSWEQTKPLAKMAFKDWWFHGYINEPPPEGVFMELPAGGSFHGEIACGKALTTYRKENKDSPALQPMACDKPGDNGAMGAIHATDMYPGPRVGQSKSVKGAALGIAYVSDAHKVKPEDFVVISVNHDAPWLREVAFDIPAGLPACPAAGCHCMWGWIPDPMNVQQMYSLIYRCNVTGEVGTKYPAKPQIARKCPFDKNNCTIGAKQMHYQFNLEGNNNHQAPSDAAFYNYEYGFHNGAQTDIWETDDGATWNTNTSDLAPIPWQTLTSVPWSPKMTPTWTVTPDSRGTGGARPSDKPSPAPSPTPGPSSAGASGSSAPASAAASVSTAPAESAKDSAPASSAASADSSAPASSGAASSPASAATPTAGGLHASPTGAASAAGSGSTDAGAGGSASSSARASGPAAPATKPTRKCRAKRRLHRGAH